MPDGTGTHSKDTSLVSIGRDPRGADIKIQIRYSSKVQRLDTI